MKDGFHGVAGGSLFLQERFSAPARDLRFRERQPREVGDAHEYRLLESTTEIPKGDSMTATRFTVRSYPRSHSGKSQRYVSSADFSSRFSDRWAFKRIGLADLARRFGYFKTGSC